MLPSHPINTAQIVELLSSAENALTLSALPVYSLHFIGIARLSGEILFINDAGRRLLGIPSLAAARQTMALDYAMPADVPLLRRVVIPSVLRGRSWSHAFRLRHHQTGESIAVDATMFLLRDPASSEPRALAAVCQDIVARARAEKAQREQARFLQLLSEITNAALGESHLSGILQVSVARLAEIVRADDCLIVLHSESSRRVIASAAWGASSEQLLTMQPGPGEATLADAVMRSGRSLTVEDVFASPHVSPRLAGAFPIRSMLGVPLSAEGRQFGAVLFAFNAPRRFSAEELQRCEQAARQVALTIAKARLFAEVQRLAITDYLTGVCNRRQLFALGEHEMRRAQRSGRPLSAIMLDIDHFKAVNDHYGHSAGDEVLKQVAALCMRFVRASDIVGRYGGEEFALVLPETDQATAVRIAERLAGAVAAASFQTAREVVRVTISLGVAENHATDKDLSALLKRADNALLQAKAAGRNFVAASAAAP